MACFLAPATAAVITTSIRKKVSAKYHLDWLNAMLWGGVVMLVAEHIIKGEIVWFPPFLTALRNPADIAVVLKELATIGGAMTIAVIIAWGIMVLFTNKITKTRENKIQMLKLDMK